MNFPIRNPFQKKKNEGENENKTSPSVSKLDISPIQSTVSGMKKYDLYQFKYKNMDIYFIAVDGNILYSFSIIPYVKTNKTSYVQESTPEGFSSKQYEEIKVIYDYEVENYHRTRTLVSLSNYRDLGKFFDDYEINKTFSDIIVSGRVLHEAISGDFISNLESISLTHYRQIQNEQPQQSVNKNPEPVAVSTPPSNETPVQKPPSIIVPPETFIHGNNEEINKHLNEHKPPQSLSQIKVDPHYMIGYSMKYDGINLDYDSYKSWIPKKVFFSSKNFKILKEHMVVSGSSGSGKTSFLINMINILLYHGINIIVSDPKSKIIDFTYQFIDTAKTQDEMLQLMNKSIVDYKGNVKTKMEFSKKDIYQESLGLAGVDMKNKFGNDIKPIIIYNRPTDELENIKYFTRLNILSLPELETLKIKKHAINEYINSHQNPTLDKTYIEMDTEYKSMKNTYLSDITSIVSSYLKAINPVSSDINKSIMWINKISQIGCGKIVEYMDNCNYLFTPNMDEFDEMIFDVKYIKVSSKEVEEFAPENLFIQKLFSQHKSSYVIDFEHGKSLYNTLKEINSNGNNFELVLLVDVNYLMFYLMYAESIMNKLIKELKQLSDSTNDPLVVFVTDEGNLFINDSTKKLYSMEMSKLSVDQRTTREIGISWIYGVQQQFIGKFSLQPTIGTYVIFSPQGMDTKSMKTQMGGTVDNNQIEAVAQGNFIFTTDSKDLFCDEDGNKLEKAIVKELPARSHIPPGAKIQLNYMEKCAKYELQESQQNIINIPLSPFTLKIYSLINQESGESMGEPLPEDKEKIKQLMTEYINHANTILSNPNITKIPFDQYTRFVTAKLLTVLYTNDSLAQNAKKIIDNYLINYDLNDNAKILHETINLFYEYIKEDSN
jgi:hypothetical protein